MPPKKKGGGRGRQKRSEPLYEPINVEGERGVGNTREYLVRWRGYADPTWEPAKTKDKEIPDLVAAFRRRQAQEQADAIAADRAARAARRAAQAEAAAAPASAAEEPDEMDDGEHKFDTSRVTPDATPRRDAISTPRSARSEGMANTGEHGLDSQDTEVLLSDREDEAPVDSVDYSDYEDEAPEPDARSVSSDYLIPESLDPYDDLADRYLEEQHSIEDSGSDVDTQSTASSVTAAADPQAGWEAESNYTAQASFNGDPAWDHRREPKLLPRRVPVDAIVSPEDVMTVDEIAGTSLLNGQIVYSYYSKGVPGTRDLIGDAILNMNGGREAVERYWAAQGRPSPYASTSSSGARHSVAATDMDTGGMFSASPVSQALVPYAAPTARDFIERKVPDEPASVQPQFRQFIEAERLDEYGELEYLIVTEGPNPIEYGWISAQEVADVSKDMIDIWESTKADRRLAEAIKNGSGAVAQLPPAKQTVRKLPPPRRLQLTNGTARVTPPADEWDANDGTGSIASFSDSASTITASTYPADPVDDGGADVDLYGAGDSVVKKRKQLPTLASSSASPLRKKPDSKRSPREMPFAPKVPKEEHGASVKRERQITIEIDDGGVTQSGVDSEMADDPAPQIKRERSSLPPSLEPDDEVLEPVKRERPVSPEKPARRVKPKLEPLASPPVHLDLTKSAQRRRPKQGRPSKKKRREKKFEYNPMGDDDMDAQVIAHTEPVKAEFRPTMPPLPLQSVGGGGPPDDSEPDDDGSSAPSPDHSDALDELQRQLSQWKLYARKVRTSLNTCRATMAQKDSQIASLNEASTTLHRELAHLQTLQTQAGATIEQQKGEMSRLNLEMQNLRQEKQATEANVSALKASNEGLFHQIQQANAARFESERTSQQLELRIAQLNQKVILLEQEKAFARSDSDTRLAQVNSQLVEARQREEQKDREIKVKDEQIQALGHSLTTIRHPPPQADSSDSPEIRRLNVANKQLAIQLEHTRGSIVAGTAELRKNQEKITQLQQDVASRDAQLNQLKHELQLAQLQQPSAEQQQRQDQLSKDKLAAENEVAQLKAQLQQARAQSHSLPLAPPTTATPAPAAPTLYYTDKQHTIPSAALPRICIIPCSVALYLTTMLSV